VGSRAGAARVEREAAALASVERSVPARRTRSANNARSVARSCAASACRPVHAAQARSSSASFPADDVRFFGSASRAARRIFCSGASSFFQARGRNRPSAAVVSTRCCDSPS